MNTNAEPRAATRGRRWFSRSNRLLLAGIVAAMAALSLVAQVALAGPPSPTGVPDQITPGDGNKVFLVGHGVGVQIYTCNGAVWSSAVPRANLYDDNGKLIINHFAGPTLAGEGRQQGRRHGRGQGHPRPYRHSLGAPVRKDDSGARR